jgi:hypothetical protein
MRWITQQPEFQNVFLRARTGVYIDSGRVPTQLRKLTFDDVEVCTSNFAALLQKLMEYSGESVAHYIILDPDPVHYFHRHLEKYPALEIARGDSANAYLISEQRSRWQPCRRSRNELVGMCNRTAFAQLVHTCSAI